MKIVHYLSTRKNAHHGEAIAAGFGARCVPVEQAKLEPGDDVLHIVGGLQFGGLELMQQLVDSRLPYVFCDRAYFGGGPGSDVLRVTANAYQQRQVLPRPLGRDARFGVELKPWREKGEHILLVPPGAAICRLFNLGNWEVKLRQLLGKVTKRPIRTSTKGDPVPLSERLDNCHAVVTYSSNVAVEAVCAGVPAFVSNQSAARPVAGWLGELDRYLELPPMPPREAWAASLAWGQFTLAEIRDGLAARVVLGQPEALAA